MPFRMTRWLAAHKHARTESNPFAAIAHVRLRKNEARFPPADGLPRHNSQDGTMTCTRIGDHVFFVGLSRACSQADLASMGENTLARFLVAPIAVRLHPVSPTASGSLVMLRLTASLP